MKPQITTNGDALTASLGKTSITVLREIDHAKLQDRIATSRAAPAVRLGWTDDDCEVIDRPLAVRQEEACLLALLLAVGGADRPSQWVEWCNEAICLIAKEGGDTAGLHETVDRAQTLPALRTVHESLNQLRARARRERLAAIAAATAPGAAIGDGESGSVHGAWGAAL
jgi:hypothetical protein